MFRHLTHKPTPYVFIATILSMLAILLNACASGNTAATETSTNERMVEYVGAIPDTELFVAIAVGPAGDVLAYICDGMGVDFLFRGNLKADNALELNSEAGSATLQATIESAGFSGSFSIDGKTYPFTVTPAKDFGGLYRLVGLSETEAEGTSQSGSTAKITLLPDKTGLNLSVTTLAGDTFSVDRFWTDDHIHSEPVEYREHWIVLLNDGQGRGGRIKSSFEAGIKSIDPICLP